MKARRRDGTFASDDKAIGSVWLSVSFRQNKQKKEGIMRTGIARFKATSSFRLLLLLLRRHRFGLAFLSIWDLHARVNFHSHVHGGPVFASSLGGSPLALIPLVPLSLSLSLSLSASPLPLSLSLSLSPFYRSLCLCLFPLSIDRARNRRDIRTGTPFYEFSWIKSLTMGRSDDDDGRILHSRILDDEDPEYVETDPTGRYGRFNVILGKGAYKTVYRAFDDLDGIEVAWNQVDIRSTLHNSGDMERLYSELHLLKMLKHGNIMKFCYSWVDHQRKTVNFITEIFTSGTLRQYRQKHKRVNLKAIKHWCRQILKGLVYLHGHDPPVIHRDLKCDNIFINGNSGEVKIGDLGLAVILSQASAAHSVIGTPEFMAPELYEEHYNELVDIYSFGMCLLELVTFEYPYSECTNAAQIYKKVTSGRKPEALNRVKDLEMRKFIEKCLASASERLHADELLMDKFLQMDDNQGVTPFCQSIQLDPHDDLGDLYSTFKGRNCKDTGKDCEVSQDKLPGNASVSKPGILLSKDHGQDIQVRAPRWKKSKDFRIKVKKLEDRKVHVRFRITSSAGDVRFIQFDFDLDTDTAITVAQEMVSELDLVDQDPVNVAEMIDMELMALLPEWKRVSCLEEAEISRYIHRQPQCLPEGSEVVMSKTETINAPSFTIETSEDIRSSNEICMHGRFEEVEFHLSECQDARQEPDSTGGFSDFSSEQFEGGYSDLSLDASFDGLSARIAINDMLSEQEMDESMTDVKRGMAFLHQESSFSLHEGDKVDHDSDTEELRMLMLLQKREVKSLQHRHDQELLTLRTQLNQEAQDSATQFMLQDQSTLRTFHGADEFNKRNDTEFQQCFTTEITELPLEAFKDRLESVACDSVAIDPYVTYTEPNMSMRSELTEKPSLESCIEQEISSSVTDLKFPAAMTDEDIEKSSFSGLPVIQSRSSGEFTGNKTGRLVDSSKMSAEPVSLRNGGVHSSVQQSSILKRQSYLEYYKGVSNQREKALPVKQHSTSDGASKHSDQRDDQVEQARKLHLQKTIAELEAKTLECLLQSSSYVAKSTGKNPSVTSFQGSQSTSLGR